jgi:hypothetical protein
VHGAVVPSDADRVRVKCFPASGAGPRDQGDSHHRGDRGAALVGAHLVPLPDDVLRGEQRRQGRLAASLGQLGLDLREPLLAAVQPAEQVLLGELAGHEHLPQLPVPGPDPVGLVDEGPGVGPQPGRQQVLRVRFEQPPDQGLADILVDPLGLDLDVRAGPPVPGVRVAPVVVVPADLAVPSAGVVLRHGGDVVPAGAQGEAAEHGTGAPMAVPGAAPGVA